MKRLFHESGLKDLQRPAGPEGPADGGSTDTQRWEQWGTVGDSGGQWGTVGMRYLVLGGALALGGLGRLHGDLQPALVLAEAAQRGGGLGLVQGEQGEPRLGQGGLGEDRGADGADPPL